MAIEQTIATEWRRIRGEKKGLKRKGGESERGEWNNCVFIPPSDLLFCTVSTQESMEDEDVRECLCGKKKKKTVGKKVI